MQTTTTNSQPVEVNVDGHIFVATQVSKHSWNAFFPEEDPAGQYPSCGPSAYQAAEQVAALYGL